MTVAQHVPTAQRVAGAVLAALGGVCLAVQGRINGQLGHLMDDGVFAALISFAIGLVLLVAAVVATPAHRSAVNRLTAGLRARRLRWWECFGGVCGAFVVATQGIAVTTIGVAVFTVAVVSGMVFSSLFVDRAGLGPGGPQPITPARAAGAALAVVAVVVAVSNKLGHPSGGLWLAVLPALAGLTLAWQVAMNGLVRQETDNVIVPTLVNFASGMLALIVACLIDLMVRGWPQVPPGQWWLYLGGPLGIGAISSAVFAVRLIGVLVLGLASVAGQLIGAVVLDIVAPTAGGLSAQSIMGAAITMVAVGVAARRK